MSQYAEEIGFAAGTLVGFRTDIASSGVTPVRFGILQDAQLDFSADLKELYGQNRYAIAMAPGKTKVELKAKFAGIRGMLFNNLYFGATTAATETKFADNESGTVPASSTYTVTVANAASFKNDYGVFNATTGAMMTKVATPTLAGTYSVNEATGVYTFSSADASAAVYISYTYGTTGGIQIPISNVRMGVGPSFRAVLSQPFDGRQQTFILNNCQAAKLSMPTKQDDFQINELDFMVSADISGNIGSINVDL